MNDQQLLRFSRQVLLPQIDIAGQQLNKACLRRLRFWLTWPIL